MGIYKLILWVCLALLFWTFVGYPLAIWILSFLFPNPWKTKEFTGTISLIIAAHNEEKVIREKIENCLELDFGSADFEIIIISDGSTDATNQILSDYLNASDRLYISTYHPRAGKAHALNVGVAMSKGDILIFSDANVIIDPKTCHNLLLSFEDPNVGAVCGKVLVKARGTQEIAGESIYMKYEGFIQRCEAAFNSMVGIDGAFFALRRELFKDLAPDLILDDFALSMEAPLAGLRIVYENDAVAVEEAIPCAANELKRKARIVTGGFQYLSLLMKRNKPLNGKMWFEFVSHKLLRWIAPLLLILLFILNSMVLEIDFYLGLIAFYKRLMIRHFL
ncbi:MAG: hypothetical protein B6I30_10405 [Desulfobacteraceae bacterium 4572_187]|nr:MAG: hypothetical protein B6I30_10405 [Desulfobacteraceae bacterium 4572_187]